MSRTVSASELAISKHFNSYFRLQLVRYLQLLQKTYLVASQWQQVRLGKALQRHQEVTANHSWEPERHKSGTRFRREQMPRQSFLPDDGPHPFFRDAVISSTGGRSVASAERKHRQDCLRLCQTICSHCRFISSIGASPRRKSIKRGKESAELQQAFHICVIADINLIR